MPSFQNILLTPSLTYPPLQFQLHTDSSDDYFRLISSLSGKYLISITQKRQLTVFDVEKNGNIIDGFVEDNVNYAEMYEENINNQTVLLLAIVKRAEPLGIKVYKIRKNVSTSTQSSKQYSIELINTYVQPVNTTLGWVTFVETQSFSNVLFYVKNDQIYYLNYKDNKSVKLQVNSNNPTNTKNFTSTKQSCTPYYLVYDREYHQLISCSRTGHTCIYNITKRTKSSQFQYSLLLQSYSSPAFPSLTISSLSQSQHQIFLTTTKLTNTNKYHTYIIHKNIKRSNYVYYIELNVSEEAVSPGLMVQVSSVYDYIVGFIKGENVVYVYSMIQIQQKQTEIININNITISSLPIQLTSFTILNTPFISHSINHNFYSNKLYFAITGEQNQDKLIRMDLLFNCSNIGIVQTINSNNNSNNSNFKQSCNQKCNNIPKNISTSRFYFSYREAGCVEVTQQYENKLNKCTNNNTNANNTSIQQYYFHLPTQQCLINCSSLSHTISQYPYNTPSQCICNYSQNYTWSSIKNSCILSNSFSNNSIIPIPIKNDSNSSVVVPVVVSLSVLVVVGIIVVFLLYYYKKLCFNRNKQNQSSGFNQNQLKQTQNDDNNSENDKKNDNNIHNKLDTNNIMNDINVNNNKIVKNNEIISDFPDEQIQSHSNDKQQYQIQIHNADSQRKL